MVRVQFTYPFDGLVSSNPIELDMEELRGDQTVKGILQALVGMGVLAEVTFLSQAMVTLRDHSGSTEVVGPTTAVSDGCEVVIMPLFSGG
ncbi:MAG: hypothetical protein D9V47_05325 [Clostridia bacterium]|nr:MAG: hypothetical protein D9V47_05325 [Clostridia bacterium]